MKKKLLDSGIHRRFIALWTTANELERMSQADGRPGVSAVLLNSG